MTSVVAVVAVAVAVVLGSTYLFRMFLKEAETGGDVPPQDPRWWK